MHSSCLAVDQALEALFIFFIRLNITGSSYSCPCLTSKETEAQAGATTCPRSRGEGISAETEAPVQAS